MLSHHRRLVRRSSPWIVGLALLSTWVVMQPGSAIAETPLPETARVSVGTGGQEPATHSEGPVISADERIVAYHTTEAVTPGDTNGATDVLLRDRVSGGVINASVSDDEQPGNAASWDPRISADGMMVAFRSNANNLDGVDNNNLADVFVRDLTAGTTVRVSATARGEDALGMSWPSAVSADGSHVLFGSTAENLVPGDTNGVPDLFLRDLGSNTLELVSVGDDEQPGNGHAQVGDLSANGDIVTFGSLASNLTDGDANGSSDVFVRDRLSGSTERISYSNGDTHDPSISDDGQVIAYDGAAPPGVGLSAQSDVMVYDRKTGVTTRVSERSDDPPGTPGPSYDGQSFWSDISRDGAVVTFASTVPNLVNGDTNGTQDVFRHDREVHTTTRVSVSTDEDQADGLSDSPSSDADGSAIAFGSSASNLVDGDTNGVTDAFVHDLDPSPSERIVFANNRTGNWELYAIRPDGSGLQNLTNTSSVDERYPRVSPRGGRILFTANGSIFVAPLSNLAARTEVVVGDQPGWFPDEERLIFTGAGVTTPPQLFVANIDGSGVRQLTANDGIPRIDPDVSPDGRYVVFATLTTTIPPDPDRIWLKLIDTSDPAQVVGAGIRPSFNPVATGPYEVFYNTTGGTGNWDVYKTDPTNPSPVRITSDPEFTAGGRSSPDGQRIALESQTEYLQPGRLAVINADGTGQQIIFNEGSSKEADWTDSPCIVDVCGTPAANAGNDKSVASDAAFPLDGSGSSDPEGGPLEYQWVQVSGPSATIRDEDEVVATVDGVVGPGTFVFRVTVTDTTGLSHSDEGTIQVRAPK